MREYYDDFSLAPSAQAKKATAGAITASWSDILAAWSAVELDFQDQAIYGIDLESDILDRRSWRWLFLRIVGLISTESSRLHRVLTSNTEGADAEGGADSSHST